nr:MAG TPA: hypothetical protein [Caudoviricetes sp.]
MQRRRKFEKLQIKHLTNQLISLNEQKNSSESKSQKMQ